MNAKSVLISRATNWFFYIAVIIEVLIVLVDRSNYTNPVEGRLFQITFVLFFVKTCLTRYTWKEYICIFLFCVLGAASYFVTGRNEIIRLVIFIAACKDIDMEKCLKLVFGLTFFGCLVIICMSVTGIYGAISLTQDYGRGSVETRYTLGMGHPNALQCMVWSLSILGLYLYGKIMKWWHYLILLIVNIFFFFLTDSRTSLIVTLYAMGLIFLVTQKQNILRQKIINWIGIITAVGSIGVSIVAAFNAYRIYNYIWYDDRSPVTMVLYYLNKALNGRIRVLTGTTRFEGTPQTWKLFSGPENNYFFDLGWVRVFYWYGVIPGCVFVAAIILLLFFYYRKNEYMSIALIAAICLYTVIEAHVISVYLARNYIFFLMGASWCEMLKEPMGIRKNGDRERKEGIGKLG